MREGDDLPTIERLVTQGQIERYAEASGDFNPIHVDKDYAAKSQFGSTIAHGMMIAASISEMMTLAFKEDWLNRGRLKIRFRAPVFPGDTVTMLEFFLGHLGPAVYNQAVKDASRFMHEKLQDLEGEVYEPDDLES